MAAEVRQYYPRGLQGKGRETKCSKVGAQVSQGQLYQIKKKLEVAYQWQVDDMFFYGYRCCMKKHGITDDIPNIPLDDEDKAMLGDEAGQDNGSAMGKGSAAVDDVSLETSRVFYSFFGCFYFILFLV